MTAALEVRGMVKSYGGARALDGLDLHVAAGEVHALLGQNGCGKSTLVKALTGVHSPDSGVATVFGRELTYPVTAPHTHGIAVIHQDIGVVDQMTVLENLGVNAGYGTRLLGAVNTRREKRVYGDLMDRLDISLPFDTLVSDLAPAERSLLAVVRAMRLLEAHEGAGQLFILDEPTAALSGGEAERLLALMRRMADLGAGVVFISHRLAEVMEVCDSMTVVRAGRAVATSPVARTTREDIVAAMLGRRMEDFFPAPPPEPVRSGVNSARTRLVVDGLSGDVVQDATFTVHAGEVVGVTGLAGMGQEELPGLIAGVTTPRRGYASVDGTRLAGRSPREAIDATLALVPGNRLRDGCWIAGSAAENLTLPVLSRFARPWGIDSAAETDHAAERMAEVGTFPNDPRLPMAAFSGGNQQKVVFAKWLQTGPGVLLLDEPTQGVDPGAAHDLLEDVVEIAERGSAVVVFSGDHEQLAAICHRVLVLHHGRTVAEITRASGELTEANLLHACETPAAA
ncbi:sugar ABC transporter ATP-binding protein [Kineococcus rhizosphaerae]|uniref:Ribose transport system ATP-binding protein n=1 Tax=Kineococcus rhizosphaerae TaxID=559628 RepID=A0A2T0QXT9_9ACTN|nr:sugar ABC transporter ATP-binding protein [Kineococcus rhizosphaerae]PRY10800.1 ribose transport system ATP-binding protein [Kineococcus rhizosphaerae]